MECESSTSGDAMVLYKIKRMSFIGRRVDVVYHDGTEQSALLSMCNVLLLRSKISLNLEFGVNTLSETELIEVLCNSLLSQRDIRRSKISKEDIIKKLQKLAGPTTTDLDFTSIDSMKTSDEHELFSSLGIDFYHGFVVDPKEEDTAHSLGVYGYQALAAGILARQNGAPLLEEMSHLTDEDWNLIEKFLNENTAKFTPYGLKCLKENLKDKTVCTLFWDRRYHVLLKFNGSLYLLQNDPSCYSMDLAWRMLTSVNNNGDLFTSYFEIYRANQSYAYLDKMHMMRRVKVRGCIRSILYSFCGSSALLALCNCLLLKGDLDSEYLKTRTKGSNIVDVLLIAVLFQFAHIKKMGRKMTPNEAEKIIALGNHVHLNTNFSRIDDFKQKELIKWFGLMGVKLFHGFIVDTEEVDLARAIGGKYSDEVSSSSAPSSADSLLINKFLKDNSSMLTSAGLQRIIGSLSENEICVIYWKNLFHTAMKQGNTLLVLQTDSHYFSKDIHHAWKRLDKVVECEDLTIKSKSSISTIVESKVHKCARIRCSSEYNSECNLKRHNSIHLTAPRGSMVLISDFARHRHDISQYWDDLTQPEAKKILDFCRLDIEKVPGNKLVESLEQKVSKSILATRLLVALKPRQEDQPKMSSKELFGVLDECSEGTFLCNDWRSCKEYIHFGGSCAILSELNNILACCSYLIEENLINKWCDHATVLSDKFSAELVQEDENRKLKELKRKKDQEDKAQLVKENAAQRVDGRPEDDTKDNQMICYMCGRFKKFLTDFKINGVNYFEPQVQLMRDHYKSLEFHVNFLDIMNDGFEELGFYLIDNYRRVESEMTDVVTQYLSDHGYSDFDKDKVKLRMHELPSSERNMSFTEYVRRNKLIMPYKIPKKYVKIFRRLHKRRVYILTYKGRKALRGCLNELLKLHKAMQCLEGAFDISNFRIVEGSFVILGVQAVTLSNNGFSLDLANFIKLFLPFYQSSPESPVFLDELVLDCANLPDITETEKFFGFLKYMSGHFVFMPPHGWTSLVSDVFQVADSLRQKARPYAPLDRFPSQDSDNLDDWTTEVIGIILFKDVYYFKSSILGYVRYENTMWHLCRYGRHFKAHVLDPNKVGGMHDIRDTVLADLMLAHRLGKYITGLIRLIFSINNMDGQFARGWITFLKSDDADELEKLWEENVEIDSDDESDEEADFNASTS